MEDAICNGCGRKCFNFVTYPNGAVFCNDPDWGRVCWLRVQEICAAAGIA